MAALRERPEDIRALAEYFQDEFCRRNNFKPKSVEPEVFELLEHYHWPGNARELRNTVERMAILTPGDGLTVNSVPIEIRVGRDNGPRSSLQATREAAERDHILRALETSEWNVSSAARTLGMERTNLHKRMKSLGISR